MPRAQRANAPARLGDPKFSELIVMTPGSLAAFGAKSMSRSQYGRFNFPVFDTLDYARANRMLFRQDMPQLNR